MPLRLPGLSDPSKAWEDGSAGGGELSSLRGPGHPPAVLFYFFGSWSGMLIWHEDKSGRVLRFRVRPHLLEAQGRSHILMWLYASWPSKRPQRQGTWAHAALGMGDSPSEESLN